MYHPPSANDDAMLDYLTRCLTEVEGLYPGCGIVIAGDFNKLDIKVLSYQFQLKQLVNFPTRGNNTLDLVLTNIHSFYKPADVYPPFGLSDHHTICIQPKQREMKSTHHHLVYKRDTRPSRRLELGRYLSQINWNVIDSNTTCEEKNQEFESQILLGLDNMPEKQVKVRSDDPPWVSEHFKSLIKKRQRAFSRGDVMSFKYFRNKVNRERKILRASFYTHKVSNLKKSKPKDWWKEVKRLSGMTPASGSDTLLPLQIPDTDHLNPIELANVINRSFLEPLNQFNPLSNADLLPPTTSSILDPPRQQITSESVCRKLKSLNPAKASGPDGIPNWLLKEYADILADPVSTLLETSFQEQKLPTMWKCANVTPIPKVKPVREINKHLRPISLTPVVSKIAEEFVVEEYFAPAVLKEIDPMQFGGIPKLSATQALISMVHKWSEATDGTGAAVRVLVLDYRKAFDFIDHQILANKIRQLNLPPHITNWILDFLTSRFQRVKLSREHLSDWGAVPSGVPQGTKLGPWLFILMINDLKLPGFDLWKYIDDTTISEVVPKYCSSTIQRAATDVEDWSADNKFQLNVSKCKELTFQFTKHQQGFPTTTINNDPLDLVNHAKILGLTISNDLKWNEHISNIVKKANKRLYFIIQLKRAKVPVAEIIRFYSTCVRPVLEYSCEVFHFSLPKYLSNAIERVQKRVISIVLPGIPYEEGLTSAGLCSLSERREKACFKLFRKIVSNPEHKLSDLLPSRAKITYNLRKSRTFNQFKVKTNRFKNSFIPACLQTIEL